MEVTYLIHNYKKIKEISYDPSFYYNLGEIMDKLKEIQIRLLTEFYFDIVSMSYV